MPEKFTSLGIGFMKNSPPARIAAFMSLLSFLDASWQNFAFRPGRSANIFLVHSLR